MPISRSVPTRFLRLVIVLVLVGTLLPVTPAMAQSADEKPTLLGLATGNFRTELPDFTQEAGKPPAIFQLFWTLEIDWSGGNNAWVGGMLTELESLGATAYLEITTNDLTALNQGAKDNDLQAMAQTVADWLNGGANRHILIAPLPEMNLNHPWGGDASGFKAGYQRIRQAFLDEGLTPSQIRFVFAPNGTSDVGEHDDYYPGDAVVDIIGFARLNRGNPWLDYDAMFQTHINELQARISLSKPILVTQTGSVIENGNRDVWLDDMFTNLKAHKQVIGAIYFNRDTASSPDFRVLENGVLDQAFKDGYDTWSSPGEVDWIFDGRMDAWEQERAQAYASGFIDIQGNIFQNAIAWLAGEGITQGCNPPLNTLYCPNEQVTRGQMAVFISRAQNLPAAGADHFSDDSGEFYEEAANRLFEAGITVGCAPNRYCGSDRISRDQMAAFLARILGLPGATRDWFVDDDGTFENAINKLAEAGLTSGCNPPDNDRYCPNEFVTRGQMAAFLKRAFGP